MVCFAFPFPLLNRAAAGRAPRAGGRRMIAGKPGGRLRDDNLPTKMLLREDLTVLPDKDLIVAGFFSPRQTRIGAFRPGARR